MENILMVAPFVGVWIEIFPIFGTEDRMEVAPFVGVWIEIYKWLKKVAL